METLCNVPVFVPSITVCGKRFNSLWKWMKEKKKKSFKPFKSFCCCVARSAIFSPAAFVLYPGVLSTDSLTIKTAKSMKEWVNLLLHLRTLLFLSLSCFCGLENGKAKKQMYNCLLLDITCLLCADAWKCFSTHRNFYSLQENRRNIWLFDSILSVSNQVQKRTLLRKAQAIGCVGLKPWCQYGRKQLKYFCTKRTIINWNTAMYYWCFSVDALSRFFFFFSSFIYGAQFREICARMILRFNSCTAMHESAGDADRGCGSLISFYQTFLQLLVEHQLAVQARDKIIILFCISFCFVFDWLICIFIFMQHAMFFFCLFVCLFVAVFFGGGGVPVFIRNSSLSPISSFAVFVCLTQLMLTESFANAVVDIPLFLGRIRTF